MKTGDMDRQLAIACAGFGIVLACTPLSSTVEPLVGIEVLYTGANGWIAQVVFAVAFIGTLVCLGFRGISAWRLMLRNGPMIGVVLLNVVGTIFLGMGALFEAPLPFVYAALVISAMLRGIGIGILHVAWIELFSLLSPLTKHFSSALALAVVLSGLLALALGACSLVADDLFVAAALVALPCIDVLLLRLCVPPLSDGTQIKQHSVKNRVDMPATTLYIIGACGVSLGAVWVVLFTAPTSETALAACVGFLAASIALAVVTRTVARSREYPFGMLLRVTTLASAASFLLLPVLWLASPELVLLAMGCAWATQVFTFAYMPVEMIEMLPVSPLALMAAGSLAVGVGIIGISLVGGLVLTLLGATIHSFTVLTLFVCLYLLVAAILMPSRTLDASALGIRAHMERETSLERLQRRCREVADRFGLTEREEEVMFLMAQGLSRARIAKELTVSTETVKTHAKHIYEKSGVHSLRELTVLIETGKRVENSASE